MSPNNSREHALPLFKNLSIMTVQDVHSFSVAIFMYKFCNDLLPSVFVNYFFTNSVFNVFTTRHSNDFCIPFCRTALAQKAIRFKGTTLWNNLPCNIKCQPSIHLFKRKLKQHFLEQYQKFNGTLNFSFFSFSTSFVITYLPFYYY